jgi:hypothetical protein
MKRERSRTIWNWMSWGRPFCTSASRAFTRSTTATVLVPDCLRMRRETALAPFRRESVRGSSSASATVAMSRTRTGLPLKSATMRSLKDSTDSMRPSVRRPSSLPPAVSRPPGISTFWRRRASFTCWMDRLKAVSLSGLTRIWISRFRSPTRVMAPTSLTVSSARLIRLSAISVISRAERWPDTTRARIGAESGSTFSTIGESVPAGSRESTVPTFSRTSLAASCTLRSSTKVAKTCDCPSMELERSSSRPAMVLTASSMALVIWLSISSGAAPGRRVVMVMVGRSTLGKMSTPSCAKEASPRTTSEAISMVVKDEATDEDLEEAHWWAGVLRAAVDERDGRALKNWTVQVGHRLPGFTRPRSPRAPWQEPAFEPLLDLAVRHHEDLADPRRSTHRLRGRQGGSGVLARQHDALGEEAGAEPIVGIAHPAFQGEAPSLHLDGRRDAGDLPGEGLIGVGLHRELEPLAGRQLRGEPLRHRPRVLERIERHQGEHRRVLLHVLAGVEVALGDLAREGRADGGVAEALAHDAEARFAAGDLGLRDPEGGPVGVELGLRDAHLVGMQAHHVLRDLKLGERGVVAVPHAVHVPLGDEVLAEELLGAVQLGLRPLDLRLIARHLGLQRGEPVPDTPEGCLAGSHRRLGPRGRLAAGEEIGLGLVHGQLELARVVLGEDLALGDRIPQVRQQLRHGAGLLGLDHRLHPGDQAADGLDGALHRADSALATLMGSGLKVLVAAFGGAGGLWASDLPHAAAARTASATQANLWTVVMRSPVYPKKLGGRRALDAALAVS